MQVSRPPAATSAPPQTAPGSSRFSRPKPFTLTRSNGYASSLPTEEPWSPGLLIFGVYLIALSSLSTQFLIAYAHVNVPLIGITQLLVLIAFVIAGNHFRLLSTSFGKYYACLAVWWVVASVFSMYRRESFAILTNYFSRLYIIPFLFAGLVTTASQVRKLMYCFAWGYVLIVLYCFKIGGITEDGRFIIPNTTLANPNDLALHLLLGASFIIVLFGGKFTRLVAIGALPLLANFVLRTGSRANLLTIFVIVLMSLKILPAKQRMALLVTGLLSMALVLPFMNKASLARLTTVFATEGSDYAFANRAVGSTEARKELQRKAVIISFQNPLFGVGPGQFALATEEYVRGITGNKSTWQVTHNTYTQVSAETGFPGLICFGACVLLCIRINYRNYKLCLVSPVIQEYTLNCYALLVGSVVYGFGVLFCSIAYDYHVPILIGFTVANDGGLQKILQRQKAAAPAQEIAAAPPRFRMSRQQPLRQGS